MLLIWIVFAGAARADDSARFLLEWGKKGSKHGEFNFPIAIAINAADEVFVTDHYNARVQKFSTEGKFLAEISVAPGPSGIAVSATGAIYVGHFSGVKGVKERLSDKVTVYSPAGKLLREWGKSGSGDGEFNMPGGIAIDKEDRVYVADQTNHRVQVFDAEGKFLRKWGEYGTKQGQFGGNEPIKSRVGGPQFVAFDSAGNIYTTEASVGRVQKFTPDGKFLLAWGDNQDKPGSFGGKFGAPDRFAARLIGPIAICIDKKDRVWLSAVSGRVQQFTNTGKFVRGFGETQGSGPGQFLAPHGLVLDSHGHLYVVDSYNHRVQKFAIEEQPD